MRPPLIRLSGVAENVVDVQIQPVAQAVDSVGKGTEGAHRWPLAASGRDSGNELFRTDVDAGGVGVDLRVEGRSALARRAGSFGSTVTLSFSFAHGCA
jgi:hypothetical protein